MSGRPKPRCAGLANWALDAVRSMLPVGTFGSGPSGTGTGAGALAGRGQWLAAGTVGDLAVPLKKVCLTSRSTSQRFDTWDAILPSVKSASRRFVLADVRRFVRLLTNVENMLSKKKLSRRPRSVLPDVR